MPLSSRSRHRVIPGLALWWAFLNFVPSFVSAQSADADGDGFSTPDDCDDADKYVYPGVDEKFDGKDNDCDGAEDNGIAVDNANKIYVGGENNDRAGYSLANVGDFNGDGIDDLAVGVPYASYVKTDGTTVANAGKTYLVYGRGATKMTAATSGTMESMPGLGDGEEALASVADAVFYTATGQWKSGYSVAGIGDANKDGCFDIAIGAPGSWGSVFVVLGKCGASAYDGEYNLEDVALKFKGYSASDSLGLIVAAAGDVDGDGYSDFLMYAKGYTTSETFTYNDGTAYHAYAGKAYMVYGSVSLTGMELKVTTGDGKKVEVCESSSATSKPACTVIRYKKGDTGSTGKAALAAGDVNNDGYSDVFIGGYNTSAWLFYGSSTRTASGDTDDAKAKFDGGGDAVCVGDVNGNGIKDFVISHSWNGAAGQSHGGISYLVHGRDFALYPKTSRYSGAYDLTTSTVVKARFYGAASDQSGATLSCRGDLNGDGKSDIVLGAPGGSLGRAYLAYGGALAGDYNLYDGAAGASFEGVIELGRVGTSVSAFGDFNNDGKGDLLLSAPSALNDGSGVPGEIYRFNGR